MAESKTSPGMVRYCYAYSQGRREGEIGIEQIRQTLEREDSFVWLALQEPGEELLVAVQREFGLHELAMEDTRARHQRPKIEQYGGTLFVVMQTAMLWEERVHLGETHMFLGPRFFVTIRHGPSITYAKVRERLESQPELMSKGSSMAAYGVMDFIVDNYHPVLQSLQEKFERLEKNIFGSHFERETIGRLYELKRELLVLRNAAAPVLDITDELMRLHPDLVAKEVRLYFRDIHDHVNRLVVSADGIREMLTTAMQVNLALVTVEQNEAVRRLAGWGAILAVPTVVFSMYGMNFKNMPELAWPYAYPVALGLTALACVGLYRRLKRYGWL